VLFVDDTIDVLKTAKRFGLKWLVYKAKASSKIKPLVNQEFVGINDFKELLDD